MDLDDRTIRSHDLASFRSRSQSRVPEPARWLAWGPVARSPAPPSRLPSPSDFPLCSRVARGSWLRASRRSREPRTRRARKASEGTLRTREAERGHGVRTRRGHMGGWWAADDGQGAVQASVRPRGRCGVPLRLCAPGPERRCPRASSPTLSAGERFPRSGRVCAPVPCPTRAGRPSLPLAPLRPHADTPRLRVRARARGRSRTRSAFNDDDERKRQQSESRPPHCHLSPVVHTGKPPCAVVRRLARGPASH